MTGDFSRLQPGFDDPVHDTQGCFRVLLDALAHPGRIGEMPLTAAAPPPMREAMAAVALTLCDIDTPVWLDAALAPAASYLRFHTGAPSASSPNRAAFAFFAEPGALPSLESFDLGSDEYPERSTTVAIEVGGLSNGPEIGISGPGIAGEARLAVTGLPGGFWAERLALAAVFPRGLDFLFVRGRRIVALPRSTRIAL